MGDCGANKTKDFGVVSGAVLASFAQRTPPCAKPEIMPCQRDASVQINFRKRSDDLYLHLDYIAHKKLCHFVTRMSF